MLYWIILIFAGLFEVGFTSCLVKAKESSGNAATLWYIAFGISLFFSMWFLIIASKKIPMSISYAVFAGVGAVGTALMGIFFFEESVNFWKIFFIFTLIASIIGLNLSQS